MPRSAGFIVAALAATLGAGCAAPAASRPALIPAAQAEPLPALTYPLLGGGQWATDDTLGHVVVLDVWATYCAPCRKSFPLLNELATRPGVDVIGLSVDEADPVVTAFLAEVPASFRIARDPGLSVQAPPLGITKLPTLLVVDRAGRLRLRRDEPTESDYRALPALLDQLAAE